MDPANVLTFNEPGQAEPIRKRLEEAGIPAALHDERKIQKYWFISEPLAGVKVRVDKKDYQRAKDVLDKWDREENVLSQAIHCPDCGSSDVDYPQFTRKFLLPTFYAVLCKLGVTKTQFYCTHCHHTWPTFVPVVKDTDAMGWPTKEKSGARRASL
ncbi:MAG TPA: DUF2007 domain-containing protein [Candidatus Saccharimonadales bacterium]|nr:DUF2007 domain-containing protein [Candidatus Saccharimonadales bacterium]